MVPYGTPQHNVQGAKKHPMLFCETNPPRDRIRTNIKHCPQKPSHPTSSDGYHGRWCQKPLGDYLRITGLHSPCPSPIKGHPSTKAGSVPSTQNEMGQDYYLSICNCPTMTLLITFPQRYLWQTQGSSMRGSPPQKWLDHHLFEDSQDHSLLLGYIDYTLKPPYHTWSAGFNKIREARGTHGWVHRCKQFVHIIRPYKLKPMISK